MFKKRNTMMLMIFWILNLCYNKINVQTMSIPSNMMDIRVFKTLTKVSLETCKSGCMLRPKCKSVVYVRSALACRMTSMNISKETHGSLKGHVLLNTFDDKHVQQTIKTCGEEICDYEEACINTSTKPYCGRTECKVLYGSYIFGNIFDVGSKTVIRDLRHGTSDIRLVCNNSGNWSALDDDLLTTDCSDTKGDDKISRLYWQPYLQTAVFCGVTIHGRRWLVIQKRLNGNEHFDRTWDEYLYGFGNRMYEFWLGLQTIYDLLSFGEYNLRVDLQDFNKKRLEALYSTFSISGPEDGFRLYVSGYIGHMGDSLSQLSNMSFSTLDRDRDGNAVACSDLHKGGWWFNDKRCGSSNLNGLYNTEGVNGSYNAIQWFTVNGDTKDRRLRRASMKIRRKI